MSTGIGLGVNANIAHPASFSTIIGEPWSELIPYVRSVTTPTLNINMLSVPHGGNPNPMPFPSNKVHTSDIFIEFMLDERFHSLSLLWEWFERTKDTIDTQGDAFKKNRADIYVPVFASTQCKEVACFKFYDAVPKSLPSMVWTYDDNTTRATSFSVTFASAYPDLTYIKPEEIDKYYQQE